MKSRLLYFIALCFISFSLLQAQHDIEIDYKSYASYDSVMRSDMKLLKKSDAIYFEEGDTYSRALPGYLTLYKKTPDFKPLNWRIAMCYFHSEEKEKALDYLLSCDTTMSPLYLFYLAKAFQFNQEYAKAKTNYQIFQQTLPDTYHRIFYTTLDLKKRHYPFDEVMHQLIASCDIGLQQQADSLIYRFEGIPVVNKASNEMTPLLGSDHKLYFSSDRKHGKHNSTQIYEIKYESNEFVGLPKLSTRLPYFPDDSRTPLCEDSSQEGFIFQSMENGGDFLMATKKKKVKVKNLKTFNTSAKEGTACFIGDDTFIFSSTRDKKRQEGDLYYSEKKNSKRWSKPVKIGGNINSTGREEVINYFDGELYFISNGPASMGGYDIFKVPYLGNNQWGEVQNLGSPINTADHDMSYIPIDSATALYCGIRPGGEGGTDIYKVHISTYTATVDTTDRYQQMVDSLHLMRMQQELQTLDSMYSNPEIMGEYGNYNAQLDSIMNDSLWLENDTEAIPDDFIKEIRDSLATDKAREDKKIVISKDSTVIMMETKGSSIHP